MSVDPSSSRPENEPMSKRRRIHHHIHHKQDLGSDDILPEQDIDRLLTRSITLALATVGFDGVDPVALESFRAEVEEYILRMLSLVTRSMLSCRRTTPIPQDFAGVLARERLSLTSLLPYLRPPVPPSISQPQLERSPPSRDSDVDLSALLGPELNGNAEKDQRPYVPANFPSFPSKHAYKFTFTPTERQSDPRHVRELATAEGRLGEEALRRLVSDAWSNRPGGSGAAKGETRRNRHDELQAMWLETMEKVAEREDASRRLQGLGDSSGDQSRTLGDSEHSLDGPGRRRLGGPVNYERQFWRKAVRGSRQGGDTAGTTATGVESGLTNGRT